MESLGRILSKLPIKGPGPLQSREIYATVHQVLESDDQQVRIGSLRRGKLILEVTSASKAFEWEAFRRVDLLKALQENPSLKHIEDVRIRVGSWRNHGRR